MLTDGTGILRIRTERPSCIGKIDCAVCSDSQERGIIIIDVPITAVIVLDKYCKKVLH